VITDERLTELISAYCYYGAAESQVSTDTAAALRELLSLRAKLREAGPALDIAAICIETNQTDRFADVVAQLRALHALGQGGDMSAFIRCSNCKRRIRPIMSSAQPGDGRPQYKCPSCSHCWTAGKTASQRRSKP
jgi:DNA-directed RNA polymerase subunit RPC12/RpoP